MAGLRYGGMRSLFVALNEAVLAWLPADLVLLGWLLGGEAGLEMILSGLALLIAGLLIHGWIMWRRFRLAPYWSACAPLGLLIYFLIAARAAYRLWRGAGVTWKGRVFTK
jgi:hypothetical protein